MLVNTPEGFLFTEFLKYNFRFNSHPDTPAGIYPDYLIVTAELPLSRSVHILDLSLSYCNLNRCLTTDIWSKRDDPKFKDLTFRRYPYIHSILSTSCKFNVITSSTFRFFRLVSSKKRIFHHCAILIHVLHTKRGYNINTCWRYLHRAAKCFIPSHNINSATSFVNSVKNRLQILYHTGTIANFDEP